jgi:hypothetical protein
MEIKMKQLLFIPVLLCSFAVNAASYTGRLVQGDDYRLFNFVVDSASNAVVRTLSYAGDKNTKGKIVLPSGFDPVVVVFDNDGTWLDMKDDTKINQEEYGSSKALKDLTAVNHKAAITKHSDGLYQDLYKIPPLDKTNWHTGDKKPYQHSGFPSGINASPVPIPAAAWLFSTGLLGLFGIKRKSASKS